MCFLFGASGAEKLCALGATGRGRPLSSLVRQHVERQRKRRASSPKAHAAAPPASSCWRHTEALQGAKTFALWPLSQAAQSCFGRDVWPSDIPAPPAWLEFEVESVEEATAVLELQGYRMLVRVKTDRGVKLWCRGPCLAWSAGSATSPLDG
jgi:hypothetical protein